MVDFMLWVWLGVVVVTIVLELITMDLVSIWFSLGGIISLLLSLIPNFYWPWQILVFVAISSLLILCFRKIAKKLLNKNSEGKTNLDLIVGQKVKVISRCDQDVLGSTKLNDVVWSIKEIDNKAIEEGEYAEIVKVMGNKLIVRKIEKEDK